MQYSYTVSKERRTSIIDDALSDDDRRHVINDSGTKEEERETTSVLLFFYDLCCRGDDLIDFLLAANGITHRRYFNHFFIKVPTHVQYVRIGIMNLATIACCIDLLHI